MNVLRHLRSRIENERDPGVDQRLKFKSGAGGMVDIEFLDPAAPRQLMSRLRRLYSRVRLDEMELNILRGILTETQKWVSRGREKD